MLLTAEALFTFSGVNIITTEVQTAEAIGMVKSNAEVKSINFFVQILLVFVLFSFVSNEIQIVNDDVFQT